MAAILAHFRFLKRRHRHKKPNPRQAGIAMQRGKEICIAAGPQLFGFVSGTRPERYGRRSAEKRHHRASKILFTDVMRKNNFRHALEQVPFQIANMSRCGMMTVLLRDLFWPVMASPVPTSVIQGLL